MTPDKAAPAAEGRSGKFRRDVRRELDRFRRLLRERGHRMTPQRLAIYRVLLSERTHPRAEDLYRLVRHEYPMISQATVYKTLELFKDLGLIVELGFGDDVNRYDVNPRPHLHMICVRCRRIFDLEDESLNEALARAADPPGFRVHYARYEYYGLCAECEARGGRPAAEAAGRG